MLPRTTSAPDHEQTNSTNTDAQISHSYDSGAGNGPFGFGWSRSLPQITRKIDKGLPQYHDADGADIFILSGNGGSR